MTKQNGSRGLPENAEGHDGRVPSVHHSGCPSGRQSDAPRIPTSAITRTRFATAATNSNRRARKAANEVTKKPGEASFGGERMPLFFIHKGTKRKGKRCRKLKPKPLKLFLSPAI